MKKQTTQEFIRDLVSDFRWSQIFAIGCLMVLSVLFIYSATYRGGSQMPVEAKKQMIFFSIGIICYLVTSLLDYHWINRKSIWIYLGGIGLLVAVILAGKTINNSRSWLQFGHESLRIQPAEFAKVTLLLGLCHYLYRTANLINEQRRVVYAALIALLPIGLVLTQPDTGTAMVLLALTFMLLFLGEVPLKFFIWTGVIGLLGAGLIFWETHRYIDFQERQAAGKTGDAAFQRHILKPHQYNRLVGFFAPHKQNRLNEGWNRWQSLVAIGSGRLQGKGWNQGDVTHGNYLPKTIALNDFIFAVYAEETGFLGGLFLLFLYAILLIGGVHVALKAQDNLGTLLAGGVTFLIFFHVFINMGMTMGILPIVGIPLPLMSAGGTFVIACMSALGLIQSVWLHRKPY